MNNNLALADKLSISLSAVCAIQCLGTPVLLLFMPTTLAMFLEGEGFHLFLSAVVIPLSTATLFMGCRMHRTWRLFTLGVFGVATLGLAALFGHDLVGEAGEKIATVVAASIIASAHIWNYRLCSEARKSHGESDCGCSRPEY